MFHIAKQKTIQQTLKIFLLRFPQTILSKTMNDLLANHIFTLQYILFCVIRIKILAYWKMKMFLP